MRKMIKAIAAVTVVSALMAGTSFAADKFVVRNDANTADVFTVNGTSLITAAGGPWTGMPATVDGYKFNVAGDFFAGNVGAGVGRLRLASNANAGFIYWNIYFSSDSNSYLSDTTKPCYAVRIDGATDKFQIRRAAPTTGAVQAAFQDLLVVSGAGNVGIGTNANPVTSKLQVVGLPTYADNATAKAALGGGTPSNAIGAFYTDGSGNVKVVY